MRPLSPADPTRVGPHQVLSRIGEGGMGEVLLVRTPADGLAALKLVRDELAHDPEFRARFAREVRAAQRVHGPHTPSVLSADPEAAVPWMATEYVPGPTLKEAVRENGPFPEPSLRVLALGLARALQAVHAAGLMHRDLKPGNVLLSPRGPQVIDFGIARAVEGTVLTKTGQAFGTPAYASPEQVVGKGLGPAGDVFSLAGVVVFAATGRPPFGTGKAVELLARVVGGAPELDAVPQALRPLLARCLAKDPAERPTTDEVVRVLSAQPLPSAEHGWLPPRVDQAVEAHRSEVRAVVDSAPAPKAQPVPGSGGTTPGTPLTPPPGGRARTALIAGAAALAVVTMAGTLGLLAASPWPGEAASAGESGGDPVGDTGPGDVGPGAPQQSDVFGTGLVDVAFAPDGESLYVAGADHLVQVDWRTGEELHRFDSRPNSMAAGPDDTLVGAFGDATLVWGPDREITHYLESPDLQQWFGPQLSADGTRLAISVGDADNDPMVQVWNLETEEVEFEFEAAGYGNSPDINADGTLLVANETTDDDVSTVWDLTTGEIVVEFPNDDFPEVMNEATQHRHLRYLAFHPTDPSLLAVKTSNTDIALYDLSTGGIQPLEEADTGGNYLYEIQFSADGSRLVAAGTTGAAARGGRVWDTATGELLTGEAVQIFSQVAFHPEGTVIATLTPQPDNDRLLVLDSETFEVLHEFTG
ncbi:serine/threonine-protein kinase [Nocardiopsis ganjiahuensis]|uniref:serine/threonine-protein kinase n=1 Tax=Nocardiopsis ganjiahuensis TaxID=239984 RepID=UPI0003483848|nr:serine/threonine-protein kinase [Nocardiopsis ganjiahuensis]